MDGFKTFEFKDREIQAWVHVNIDLRYFIEAIPEIVPASCRAIAGEREPS